MGAAQAQVAAQRGGVTIVPAVRGTPCPDIEKATIPSATVAIGYKAFAKCARLQYIEFAEPCQVATIMDRAFAECTALKLVWLPRSLHLIGSEAFSGCVSLRQVTSLSTSSLVEIGALAFADCCWLGELGLPASVQQVGSGAFSGCSRLRRIDLRGRECASSGCAELGWSCVPEAAFAGCARIEMVQLLRTVVTVGDGAFKRCGGMVALGFSVGCALRRIGAQAFAECCRLRAVCFPQTLRFIGAGAFLRCEELEELVFEEPSELRRIGRSAFRKCVQLASLQFPESLETICRKAFRHCHGLSGARFPPECAVAVKRLAFDDCPLLVEVHIPARAICREGAFPAACRVSQAVPSFACADWFGRAAASPAGLSCGLETAPPQCAAAVSSLQREAAVDDRELSNPWREGS